MAAEDQDGFAGWRRAVRQLEVQGGPFALYRDDLERLLNKVYPRQRLERVPQTVLWKLNKEDFHDLLFRIERMKAIIAIALDMDHT